MGTDESIKAIATGCGSLNSLDVSRCKRITGESIKALAAGCTSLTSLNVRNCEKLTDEAIIAVSTLPELTTLDTTNTFRQIFKAKGSTALSASISFEGDE